MSTPTLPAADESSEADIVRNYPVEEDQRKKKTFYEHETDKL